MGNIKEEPAGGLSNEELRTFGLLFGAILSALFGLLIPLLIGKPIPLWPWLISCVFIVLALVFPSALKAAYIPWMKFGVIAGWVNTRIILGILFYFLLTPFGLVMRLFGKDPLHRKLEKHSSTYRILKEPQPREQMENPY